MTIAKDSRKMGYAITKLYMNAFATYRDNIYKVEGIFPGQSRFLEWDTYEKMKQRLHLLDPQATFMLPTLKKPSDPSEMGEYITEFMEKIRLREFSRVQCKLSEELQAFVCPTCHKLFIGTKFIEGQNRFMFICSNCHSILNQAPILVKSRSSEEDREQQQLIRRIKARKGICKNENCNNYNKEEWLGLESLDPEQPMASLMWVCIACGKSVVPFESFKFGYRPQEPTENLTKGITVSLAKDYDSKKLKEIPLLNKEMIQEISFSDKVKVWQVTWGYKIGQYENTQYKTFPNNEYYCRQMTTQGISIKLNPKAFENAVAYLKNLYSEDPDYIKEFEEDISSDPVLQVKRWVLHTLKHAILMFLPVITGLPHQEFGGSYDLDENKVLIYDNQDGGIGGCEKLFSNYNDIIDLFDLITSRISECDCKSKCPKCLVLETCGEVNQALNRHLLVPLFIGVDTFYD